MTSLIDHKDSFKIDLSILFKREWIHSRDMDALKSFIMHIFLQMWHIIHHFLYNTKWRLLTLKCITALLSPFSFLDAWIVDATNSLRGSISMDLKKNFWNSKFNQSLYLRPFQGGEGKIISLNTTDNYKQYLLRRKTRKYISIFHSHKKWLSEQFSKININKQSLNPLWNR